MTEPHTIDWSHDLERIVGTFTCPGGDIACRLYCTGLADESCGHSAEAKAGDKCTCGGPLVLSTGGGCNYIAWVTDEGSVEEFFEGEDSTPVHDGPVEFRWDGDTWLWRYTDVPS